tara:strand:- start:479 stop:1729 length:1251 start_codon:yes stop_codon:yes gene_type:complete
MSLAGTKISIAAMLFRLALVCVSAGSTAGVKDYTVSSEGIGATQEMALRDALSKAIAQVTGVEVSTESSIDAMTVEAEALQDGITTTTSAIGVSQRDGSKVKTEGFVKSYRIVNVTKNADGLHVVRLSAIVPKFEAEASSNRKKIALTQAKVLSATRLFDVTSPAEIGDMVDQAIESALLQSRKFAVLSRRNLADMDDELNLIASGSVSKREKAKLGQLLGGDYILIPEIANANAYLEQRRSQITGQTKSVAKGGVTLSMRVINAATGEIKFSGTYVVRSVDHNGSLALVNAVASDAIADLVERIYPARVIKVSGNELVINFGGDSIQLGSLFRIFREGERMVDPYTGESLGAVEHEVALAEVIRVDAKVAYARIVGGEGVAPGMVLRRDRKTEVQLAAPPIKNEPKKKGFSLPFD